MLLIIIIFPVGFKNHISKGARCKYAINNIHKNNNIQDTGTYN